MATPQSRRKAPVQDDAHTRFPEADDAEESEESEETDNPASPEAEAGKAEPEEEDDEFDLDLDLQSVPVTLRTRKGDKRLLRLWELDGVQRDRWLNKVSAKSNIDAKGRVTKSNHEGSHSSLLCMCLRTRVARDDGSKDYYGAMGTLIDEQSIQAFPARVQAKMFDKVLKMSGLDTKAEEEAKND